MNIRIMQSVLEQARDVEDVDTEEVAHLVEESGSTAIKHPSECRRSLSAPLEQVRSTSKLRRGSPAPQRTHQGRIDLPALYELVARRLLGNRTCAAPDLF
jgi:hypothetical protein